MSDWSVHLVRILVALLLVGVNGFFVAAEFSLVKIRISRIEQLVVAKRLFAKTARWLAERLEQSLSACQLGITMASLALGYVGEPAFEHVLSPMLGRIDILSDTAIKAISFVASFTLITSLHLVIGEQAPKIFAIRQPENLLLWCAVPLKMFYLAAYPLMSALSVSTDFLLSSMGLGESGEQDIPYTEQEIRALLREAHIHGNLTRSEHRLIDAVFEFDDMVCRRIMVPRGEVEYIDINEATQVTFDMMRRTKHTRYPVCDGSLDEVLGVLHVKDLVGRQFDDAFDFRSIMRPPKKVPENMPISKLLRHFQGTHQLLAFVIDEYGTIIGVVTLENVLEEIIGDVADEFDIENPEIVPDGPDSYIIQGSTAVGDVEDQLQLSFGDADVDTMGGLLMDVAERILSAGDVINLGVAEAKVLEVVDDRVTRMRLRITRPANSEE